MSRGLGAQQRRILAALHHAAYTDHYRIPTPTPPLLTALLTLHTPPPTTLRARWRWHTIDLLGLAGPHTSPSERSSLRRAINALTDAHAVQALDRNPYTDFHFPPLADIDPRWPTRRALWFRLPPTADIPDDDQAAILTRLTHLYLSATELEAAIGNWSTPDGQFLHWILCGPEPPTPGGLSGFRGTMPS
ncbi:MAG: hypothetical protein KDB70_20160 [Mycobacterium sp.]|nr:hypothetical protein [Mycobacterium sp.]